jgi:hypothetical protein
MSFLQTNVCISERTPHAPSLMLQVAGRGYAELLRTPSTRNSGNMASPREYRPCGEAVMQPRGETDQVNSNKLRIPTLQANNTDPVGKREPFNWRQRTVRCRRWWNRYRLTAVFPGKVRAVRQRPPINDPMRKDYRPCGEIIPTLGGDFYRPCGEIIPILRGYFTDHVGVDYRPYGETRQIKYLQRGAFRLAPSVYMMLCLCLMFCLVNREVIGG